jgi:hypothetical protein
MYKSEAPFDLETLHHDPLNRLRPREIVEAFTKIQWGCSILKSPNLSFNCFVIGSNTLLNEVLYNERNSII